MKDYSQFIPSSFGFITKYEIVGDEIHVYTAETKKGEPHKYPLECLSSFEKRLGNQYQLIIENRDIVKSSIKQNLVDKIYPTFSVLAGMSVVGAPAVIVALNSWWGLALIAGVLPYCIGNSIISNKLKKFDKEIDLFKAYLNNRANIEKLSKTDPNVTAYLSFSAAKRLSEQDKLKEAGILDNALNIDFMDKTSLEDLKQLLSRYMISKSLHEKQKFVSPEDTITKSKPKTKTLKKTNTEEDK